MNEIVSIRSAARQLGKSHSTISRYVQGCPELNRGTAERPLVNVEEVRRHRLENLNAARIGNHAGRLFGAGEAPPPAATGTEAPPNYAHAKAVRETVLAKRARIDLDEKCGLLVPRAEIQDAVFDAGRALQRDLLELAGQLAERIAAMDDPHEISELLNTEHRRVLAALAASLRAKAAAEEEPRTPGEVTPLPEITPARL
ncbi:MAG: hypothetical protein O7B24_10630 [Alphaproteobacteria bacterium]|nr:hypothetical protein [Alphaproteobacteria bacterium]